MKKIVVILALALALGACTTTGGQPNLYHSQTLKSWQGYRDSVSITSRADGMRIARAQSLDSGFDTTLLRSFSSGSEWNSHQIYVSYGYRGDWRYFNTAGMGGEPISVTVIDRDVVSCSSYGCSFRETFAADINDRQLLSGVENGLTIEFYSRSGQSLPITLSSAYVRGYAVALGLIEDTDPNSSEPQMQKPLETIQ
tara:strand:+ start:358 stop:948 length:591 start_codon:yes stop_codon:yes gene_type:complete